MGKVLHHWAIKDCTRETTMCDGTPGAPKVGRQSVLMAGWNSVNCPWCQRARENGVPTRVHKHRCTCKKPALRTVRT